MKQIIFKIGISVTAIAIFLPVGLAYAESDRQTQTLDRNLVAQSKKICTNQEIDKVYRKCKLDTKREYERNLSKCRQDMPSNADSCKDLFSQMYQNSLKECDDKKSELEKQRDTICRNTQPDLNSVTQNRQSSPSSSSTGKSRSRTRTPSKPSNNTRDNSQNTNQQTPSTDPQANNQNPPNPKPLPDNLPKRERNKPKSKPPSNSQPNIPSTPLEQAREIARQLRENYSGWKEILPDCPCTRENVKKSSEFEPADCNPLAPLKYHHPGAKYCYRQKKIASFSTRKSLSLNLPPLRPGQQCAYDLEGKLMTEGAAAGTPDAYSPNATFYFQGLHTKWDDETWSALPLDEYHQTWTPNKGCNCGGERSVVTIGESACVAPTEEKPKKAKVKVYGPVKSAPPGLREGLERIRRGNTK